MSIILSDKDSGRLVSALRDLFAMHYDAHLHARQEPKGPLAHRQHVIDQVLLNLALCVPEQAVAALRVHLGFGQGKTPPRPTVVCLCGSTRFWREFQRAGLAETMAGRIVLSIGAASGTDDEHFGNLPRAEYDRIKRDLDELHLRKIDLADEVLVLNVDGYVGESTARELAYARRLGKRVRFLEPDKAPAEGGQPA